MSLARDSEVLPDPGERMTAADYFRLPEGPPWFQLIDGQLFVSPSPNYFHQTIVANLHLFVGGWVKVHGLGKVVMASSDVQLDEENVFQPDLYFVRKERLGIIDRQGPKGAPDLVIEVISSSTSKLDLGTKRELYARRGVTEFWAVFPDLHEVEIHRLAAGEPPVRFHADATLTTLLLPGLTFPVAELFAT